MNSQQTARIAAMRVHAPRPVPMKARRTVVVDPRATMTRVFRTRSSGLVAEFGR